MASELRVNSSTNRSGLGTITYTDSGPIISGVGTFTNGFTVDGTQTTVKSLKLTGDNYNANWFKTTNKLRFNDNAKATFGTSDDLSIFHNASDSVITHGAGGTGNLKILSGGAQSIECIKAGAVNIAHNGSTKLATTAQGIDVTGHSELDNVSIAGVTTITGTGTNGLFKVERASGAGLHIQAQSALGVFGTTSNHNLRLISNGNERILLSTNGNVGINDSSPDTRLSVTAASGTDVVGKFTSTDARAWIQLRDNSTTDTGVMLGAEGDDMLLRAGSDTRLRIESNGYVNIGTGTAEQQLTVQNSAQHSLIRVISNTTSDTGVDFGDTADSDIGRIRYSNNGDYMTFRVNNINAVRFDSSGRVQIGGGDTPSQVGDGSLIVYSTDRLHPAIKPAGMSNNYANGWTLLGDNYQADESQINLGVSYSSSSLVLSRGVKVSGSADNTYLSSQDSYATRPCAIRMDELGAFNFLTTETNAATTTDSAVSLTEVFKIDRVGNVYQKISGRNMYFGASNQLRIGVQHNGDPNIEAVSGDLKLMKGGTSIMQLRADGFEMKQDIYFGTAGKGIVLGNTSNVDANTLDAYEEGTFTPTILNGWGILNSNPSVATGKYVRIGAIVYIYFSFKEGSGTGASFNGNRLSFYNFPYQAEGQWPNSTNYSHPLEAYTNSASSGGENIIGLPSSNGATVFSFVQKTSSGYTSFTGSNLGSSGQLFCAGVYRINGT